MIVNAAIESSKVVALDKSNGKEKWTFGVARRSWSTPAVVESDKGSQEFGRQFGEKRISGLDQKGKELWHCEGLSRIHMSECDSGSRSRIRLWSAGPNGMSRVAVRTGGAGDVNATHVLWRERGGANVPTPVVYKGHLFGVNDQGGVAFCLDAKTGKSDYQKRLQANLQSTLQPVAYQPPGGRGRRGMKRGGPGGGFGGGLSILRLGCRRRRQNLHPQSDQRRICSCRRCRVQAARLQQVRRGRKPF